MASTMASVTVSFSDLELVLTLDVDTELLVSEFAQYALDTADVKAQSVAVLFNSKRAPDGQTLKEAGIGDNDIVMLLLNVDEKLAEEPIPTQSREAALKAAERDLESRDPNAFKEYQKNMTLADNLRFALEELPEAFAPVTMLFVNVEINGHLVKAFVDSGAQTTIMNPECVERCQLGHLVDTRHRGIAFGVGQSEILGRIYISPIKFGSSFFQCSFTVLKDMPFDVLIGLDMMKHHQAVIDLKNNRLVLGDVESVPFLPEHEIPVSEEHKKKQEEQLAKLNVVTNAGAGGQSLTSTQPSLRSVESSNGRRLGSNTSVSSASSAAAPKEEDVTNLMSLGFSRERVMKAIARANGNTEFAASILFEQ